MSTSDINFAWTEVFFIIDFFINYLRFLARIYYFNEKSVKIKKIVRFILIFHLGIMPVFRANCIWFPRNFKNRCKNLEKILVLKYSTSFMFLLVNLFLAIPIIQ